MSENSDNSPVSNANQPNNTATNPPPRRRKKFFEFLSLDFLTKGVGLIGTLGGLWWATDHFTDKLAAATLLNQREQAETALRATMFNNLMDRIVNKEKPDDPEKLLLLAQLLALNFHEHFEFKPLLIDLYKKLPEEKDVLESLARRITDQQIDMLRAIAITQGDLYKIPGGKQFQQFQDVYTSDIFFEESKGYETLTISYECNYIDPDSFSYLIKITPELEWLEEHGKQLDMPTLRKKIDDAIAKLKKIQNSQQNPASFINAGPSQCVTVVPPEGGYRLDIAISSANFKEKTVALSINVSGRYLKSVNLVYEFKVTPFDFPLTDNTAIDSDHRFAIVQKSMDKDDKRIWLRLIWFPKGYITEQERPTNYAEIQNMLNIRKEKKWFNPKTWWSNSTTPSQ